MFEIIAPEKKGSFDNTSGMYPKPTVKIPPKPKFPESSSSSGEEEDNGDDWQFYGKNFVEPGENDGFKSVRRL